MTRPPSPFGGWSRCPVRDTYGTWLVGRGDQRPVRWPHRALPRSLRPSLRPGPGETLAQGPAAGDDHVCGRALPSIRVMSSPTREPASRSRVASWLGDWPAHRGNAPPRASVVPRRDRRYPGASLGTAYLDLAPFLSSRALEPRRGRHGGREGRCHADRGRRADREPPAGRSRRPGRRVAARPVPAHRPAPAPAPAGPDRVQSRLQLGWYAARNDWV
jgi:hypothetical protein